MRTTTLSLGYSTIVSLVSERILRGEYPAESRLPSVRDLAVQFEVNPLTITRAYDKLVALGAIYALPQVGYFVQEGAGERIRELRLKHFYNERIPELRRELDLLGISQEELLKHLNNTQ